MTPDWHLCLLPVYLVASCLCPALGFSLLGEDRWSLAPTCASLRRLLRASEPPLWEPPILTTAHPSVFLMDVSVEHSELLGPFPQLARRQKILFFCIYRGFVLTQEYPMLAPVEIRDHSALESSPELCDLEQIT